MLYIIVTCYNSEDTIAKTLNSIVSQIIPTEYKIIVVDDCSTDSSLSIIREYKEMYPKYIKIVHNKKNKGAGWARRIGLKYVNKSKNNWVTFIDSDDIVTNGHFFALWQYTNFRYVDIISGVIGYIKKYKDGTDKYERLQEDYRYLYNNMLDDIFEKHNYFINTKLIRASLFKKVKYSKSRFIEDTPTLVKLILNTRSIIYIGGMSTYFYRQNQNSLCHTASDIKYNIYDTLSKIDCYKYYVKHFKDDVPKHFDLKSIVTNVALLKVNNVNLDEIYKEYPKELDTIFKFLKSKGY